MKKIYFLIALLLTGCSQGNIISNTLNTLEGKQNGVGINPSQGQWLNYAYAATSVLGNSFPINNNALGYVYTSPPATFKSGATITLVYTVTGNPNYSIADNNPPGTDPLPASITLFAWGKGDDLKCDGQFVNYRMWFPARGPLTPGTHTLTGKIDGNLWTNCYGTVNVNGFSALLNNLLGVGFTFGGANFYGHGVTNSNSGVQFTINSFTVQ